MPRKYTVKVFINQRRHKNQLMEKVTRNVIDLLVPDFDWGKNLTQFDYKGIKVKVVLNSLSKSRENWQKMVGVNCAIFLKEGS